jgi:dihydrofolate synthase/folylpolyglutamate synthase
MNYSDTIEFLYSHLPVYFRIGKAAYKADLNNTLALDEYLGHPRLRFQSIHIAGTNGKGSVSHMLASILQEAGYKTALYTSPHLKDYRERIKVNGEMISEDEVIGFVGKISDKIDSIQPSFFEISVAMAFDYFARKNIDVAVVETGLGGRLDSTNIINPLLSIITNIGFDHMDLLGNTLGKIAQEKAGIIKQNIPVLIGESEVETTDVFIKRSDEMKSPISFADKLFSCHMEDHYMIDGSRGFKLRDLNKNEEIQGQIPLAGDYQAKNIQIVAAAVKILRNQFEFTSANLINGIRNVVINTGLSGRWQVLETKPLIICDTGHNKPGLEYVTAQIKRIKKKRLHIVIGFVNDKDIDPILPLFPTDAVYYFTNASVPRALNSAILKAKALTYGLKGEAYNDVMSALNSAKKNAGDDDMIFIGGSTFVVAEVL